ncbi:MAG: dihydropteroate synthase [Myxococcota bacterium]
MAIVNVTPDSFYDGGRLHDGRAPRWSAVVEHARRCVEQGAAVLDVGGESTRPGAEPVDPEQERQRVVPVIERLRDDPGLRDVPISIDTRRASVATAALEAGASIVNDISGLADPAMAAQVASYGAGLVVGHLRGEPRTMQRTVSFEHVLAEVADELRQRIERARAAGVEHARIVVDPGIGFGKTAPQSAALVAASRELIEATGCPVLVGASRKSFLGALTDGREASGRLAGSLAAALVAVEYGARVLRVHDVGDTVQALTVARSIRQAYRSLRAMDRAGTDSARAARPQEVLR